MPRRAADGEGHKNPIIEPRRPSPHHGGEQTEVTVTRASAKTSRLLCLAVVLAVTTTAGCARKPAEAAAAGSTLPGGTMTGGTTTAPVGGVTGTVPGSADDFRVNVADRVYFDLDSHEIRADARPRLDAQAAWLRQYPNVQIRIEGNADERGTREYNIALGSRRAEAVRSYLIAAGIAFSRIDVISYGKERPIAPGSNEAAHAQNRNAHTAVTGGR